MKGENQKTRTLAVTLLLAIVTSVLVFGRREQRSDPLPENSTADPDAGIVLRHPFALSVDAPMNARPNGPPTSSSLFGVRPMAPIPANRESVQRALVALPPGSPVDRAAPNLTSSPIHREMATQTHRIVEGDSLERLAEHYLGSRERFMEIFHANREVLARPDVLPLGKRLVIPLKGWPERPVSSVPDHAQPPTVRPLVPLD